MGALFIKFMSTSPHCFVTGRHEFQMRASVASHALNSIKMMGKLAGIHVTTRRPIPQAVGKCSAPAQGVRPSHEPKCFPPL